MMIEWYLVSYVALMNIQGKFCFGITKFPPEGSPPNTYCISGVLSIKGKGLQVTSRMLTAGWLWFTHSALSLPAEALCGASPGSTAFVSWYLEWEIERF